MTRPPPDDATRPLRALPTPTPTLVDLDTLVVPLLLLDNLREETARRLCALPLRLDGGRLFVAMADPDELAALDEIAFASGKRVIPCAAVPGRLAQVVDQAYADRQAGRSEWIGAHALPRTTAPTAPGSETVALDQFLRSGSMSRPAPPLSPPLREPFHADPTPSISLTAPDRPRILVVDDEPVILEFVRKALVQRNYEVVAAVTGAEALRILRSNEIDAAVLDALLPDIHGFDICRQLRASRRYQHIPIVMMTAVHKGWRMAADLKDLYGVVAYLEKPFDMHDLCDAVARALAGTSAERPNRAILSAEAQHLYQQAAAAHRAGELDHAAQLLAQAVQVDPLAPTLRHQFGLLLAQLGQDIAAIQELELAVDLDPGRYPSLRNLAALYQRRGFRRKSRELWERALVLAPDEAATREIRQLLVDLI